MQETEMDFESRIVTSDFTPEDNDIENSLRPKILDDYIGQDKVKENLAVYIQAARGRGEALDHVLLYGPPGLGKTTLAGVIANEMGVNLRVTSGPAIEKQGDLAALLTNLQEGDVLFIDEIHTIIGAGGAEGSMDASNILKPSLTKGRLQVIGATTIAEYRKYFEKDAALERRFQPVTVEEPTEAQTIEILHGLKSAYEEFHKVNISDEAVEAAVKLSTRYINDRNLPDKAIDLIDEACSKVRIKEKPKPKSVTNKELDVAELNLELEMCVRHGDFKGAAVRKKDLDKAQAALDKAIAKWQGTEKEYRPVIDENTIEEIVSMWTGIPVTKMGKNEQQRLLKLESILHKRVVGQTEAVTAVAKAVRRGRVGLKSANRPIGSFLFLGPTGVGKTELSKTLAEAVFGSEDAMIRVDMSEYMEKHSVSKMIGSPPGYVGHEEGGQLSDQVRTHPYSVILFDEIEKAHPDVFNVLLQVLDDGRITDSQGRTVDFKNTILIMTSNIGSPYLLDGIDENGEIKPEAQSQVMDDLRGHFRPEFLNRLDEIIMFKPLTKSNIGKIVDLMVGELDKRLADQELSLELTDAAKDQVIENGYDPVYGARPLKRYLQKYVETLAARKILSGDVHAGDTLMLDVQNGEFIVTVKDGN